MSTQEMLAAMLRNQPTGRSRQGSGQPSWLQRVEEERRIAESQRVPERFDRLQPAQPQTGRQYTQEELEIIRRLQAMRMIQRLLGSQ